MTKRLLPVLTEFPPSFGGMQTQALRVGQWLDDRGDPVEVASYRLRKRPGGIPAPPLEVRRGTLARLAGAIQADLIYPSPVYGGELDEQTGLPILCRSAGG